MDLDITIDASEAIEDFEAINRRMWNGYMVPLVKGAELLSSKFDANFFSGGGLTGWQPLDPDTVKWKAMEGFPPAPLVDTGRLAAAVTSMMGPPSYFRLRDATLVVNADYAGFHQFGTRKMPAREIVFIPAEFATEMHEIIENHLLKSFGGRAR